MYAIQTEDVPKCLSDVNEPGNRPSPQHNHFMTMYAYTTYCQGARLTSPTADADSQRAWYCLQQCKMSDQAASNHTSIVLCSLHKACGQIPPESKLSKTFLSPNSQVKLQSFLELINYLEPFIPSLSSKTMFCRNS